MYYRPKYVRTSFGKALIALYKYIQVNVVVSRLYSINFGIIIN